MKLDQVRVFKRLRSQGFGYLAGNVLGCGGNVYRIYHLRDRDVMLRDFEARNLIEKSAIL